MTSCCFASDWCHFCPCICWNSVIRGQRSVRYENYCYKNVEIYEPGYYNKYGQWVGGYVKHRRKRVPCRNHHVPSIPPDIRYEEEYPNMGRIDENSCVEGSVLGGILGGGAGAALSRGDGLWISFGCCWWCIGRCQVDGG